MSQIIQDSEECHKQAQAEGQLKPNNLRKFHRKK
jgi:hypothetical protein